MIEDTIAETDGFVITKKFSNANEFSLFIEDLAMQRKVTFLDAVLDYCKESDIDPESLKSLVNQQLKEKIRVDAEQANLMKKRGMLEF